MTDLEGARAAFDNAKTAADTAQIYADTARVHADIAGNHLHNIERQEAVRQRADARTVRKAGIRGSSPWFPVMFAWLIMAIGGVTVLALAALCIAVLRASGHPA